MSDYDTTAHDCARDGHHPALRSKPGTLASCVCFYCDAEYADPSHVDRLTAELAAERSAHDLEKRAHERTWKHKAKMIDERDAAIRERDDAVRQAGIECAAKHAAIRERDARPNISRADAAAVRDLWGPSDERWRVLSALRAHAAGVDAPKPREKSCNVCGASERHWVTDDVDAPRVDAVCGCAGTLGGPHPTCLICHGTGRTEAAKGE